MKETDKHQAVRERIQTGGVCRFTVWKFGFKFRFPTSSFLPKSRPLPARLCVQHTRAGWEPGPLGAFTHHVEPPHHHHPPPPSLKSPSSHQSLRLNSQMVQGIYSNRHIFSSEAGNIPKGILALERDLQCHLVMEALSFQRGTTPRYCCIYWMI